MSLNAQLPECLNTLAHGAVLQLDSLTLELGLHLLNGVDRTRVVPDDSIAQGLARGL